MSKPLKETDIQIPDSILKKLLTSSEKRMLKNRFQILNLVEKGLSIRAIACQVKVGTDTVVRTKRLIESMGLRNLKTPEKMNTPSPWIFGKSNE